MPSQFNNDLYVEEPKHVLVPRSFKFFSKGPHPDSPRYEGRQVSHHFDNVIRGGTIGVQMDMGKHMDKLAKWWDKVRKYLPKVRNFDKRSELPLPEESNDVEMLDEDNLVGRGLINPRVKPKARFAEREREDTLMRVNEP
ncbi:uncharacterized protein CDAR_616201 [Caerostris darwini]|uniref:Uncharacterized protein n=1 Tax=Caerostris darwini TaxID=1538125 RepID=A0AAV4PUT7_9ARAC|nr:uncharacterized protein CDAR_616201 [Caerostris darwini]